LISARLVKCFVTDYEQQTIPKIKYLSIVNFFAAGGESQGRIIQRFPTKSWEDYPYEFHLEAFCQPCGWQLVPNRLPPTFFVANLTDVVGNPYFAACLTFHEAVTPQQLNATERIALLNNRRTTTQISHMANGSVHHVRLAPPKTSPTSSSLHSSESVGSSDMGHLSQRSRASATGLHQSHLDHGDPNLIRPAELYAPKCLVLLARHNHFDVLKVSLCFSIVIYCFLVFILNRLIRTRQSTCSYMLLLLLLLTSFAPLIASASL
uniref:UDENN domain-containing protein n=1 Tax=Echinostoma caproni TaxID=27848 RepID=A0A183BFR0_9TREM